MKIISQTNTDEKYSEFSTWLAKRINFNTQGYKLPLTSQDTQDIETVSQWAKAVNPDLSHLSWDDAVNEATLWYKQKLSQRYKQGNTIYEFKDGWKIVELPKRDLQLEKEIMTDNNTEWVGGIAKVYNNDASYFEGEEDIEKIYPDAKLELYSIRDPQNMPAGTIEITYDKKNPKLLNVVDIFASKLIRDKNLELIHPETERIKEFFNHLKSKGYKFVTREYEGGYGTVKASDLDKIDPHDTYGIPFRFYDISGNEDNYFESLQDAYNSGWGGSYWYQSTSFKVASALIAYAEELGELDMLERALEGYSKKVKDKNGKEVTQHKGFNDMAWDMWTQAEDHLENAYPGDEPLKEDFMIQPDQDQPAIPGLPKPVPVLDKEAYEDAVKEYQEQLKAYEEERDTAEKYFEPYIFQNYVYEKIQEAKQRENPKNKELKKKQTKAFMQTKIYKLADKADKKLPDGETLALYVKTLKEYLKDNPKIPEEWADLISNLPSPRQIRQDFSHQECRMLYETLEYLWEKIVGHRIIEDKEIVKAPESLQGNYWLLANGILLKGVNHYGIIKSNPNLFCTLLDLGGMTLQEYLGSHPDKLMSYIIRNGGVRIFISPDKRLYCQMSAKTYGDWGRDKIRNLDFKKKVVKLIDTRCEYRGWKSGIPIII